MRILYLLALLPVAAWANPIDDHCPQHTVGGAPISSLEQDTQYLCKTNYAIHYRYDTKTAEYVVEHLDPLDITGASKRKDDFREDQEVPKEFRSTLEDYSGEPYDRGHLVPGADNRADDITMSESFFLTNMVPQVPNNNRGIWRILESKVRDEALTGKDIYVVSGTIYEPGYKTIGPGHVGVPTKLWKVVYNKSDNQSIAFLLPNTELPMKDLLKYVTSVDKIEEATKLNLFPLLDENVEQSFDLKDWPELSD